MEFCVNGGNWGERGYIFVLVGCIYTRTSIGLAHILTLLLRIHESS